MTLVLVAAGAAGRTLLAGPLPSGHDAIYYLPRHVEFFRALSEGVPFPRWAPDFGGGYGQPLFEFTPPLFYYLTAGAHAAGLGWYAASAATDLILLAGAGLAMYLLAREFFGPMGGVIAASSYLLAPYFLVTLFVRYSMGDFAAFAFAPLAIWGVTHHARDGGPQGLLAGAVGIAGVLLSSNHVALMTLPAIGLAGGIFTLASRNWAAARRALTPLLLGLGNSAFFWLPALAERQFVYVDRAIKGVYDYEFHFVSPLQLIYSPWGYGGSVAGPDDGFSMSLGVPHLILGAVAAASVPLIRRQATSGAVAITTAAVTALGAAFFTTDAARPIWTAVPLLQYFQFPWRFLSLGTLAISFLAGGAALLLPRRGGWVRPLLALGIVGLLLVQGAPNAVPPPADYDLPDALTPQNVVEWGLVGSNANEFEPIWVQRSPPLPAPGPLTVVAGTATWEPVALGSHVREFSVTAAGPARLRLNTFYFPGWYLTLDGREQTIDFGNPAGLMEFDLPSGSHIVRLIFRDTPIRALSAGISLVSLLVATSLMVVVSTRHRRWAQGS